MKFVAIALLLASTAANAAYYPALGGKVLVEPDVIYNENGKTALRVGDVAFIEDLVSIRVGNTVFFSNGATCNLKTRKCTVNGETFSLD